ncbi:MAG: cell division protein FtsZ [Flavobacteriales bacterium TMED84]|nr:MAG: cell division protein FtsZ [Flavobacteriales bacterium TMED84]|tara:strand:- start:7300 stop:8928 length:1629 start_codon:yes stop_codon:yes gene_type:complete
MKTNFEFQLPKNQSSVIKVLGVGGGGSNAVNYMHSNGIKGVDFVVCNTDSQALEASQVPVKIQLGAELTEGLGAGSNPDIGKKAAEESIDRINELLDSNTKMLFITAGMGGGTGTGAAPVIAEVAKQKGILTVGVVTNPFSTEGGNRKKYAKDGLVELRKSVDTLLIINNDKLIEVYGDLTLSKAFAKANEVLNTATKGIAEVISQHLLVNIDLNDARRVLQNSGTAVMGQSEASGENRAIEAVEGALDSPLLNDNDIFGAEQVLLKIVTGPGDDEIKMSELNKIKSKIQQAAGNDVNIIEGVGIDNDLESSISVTVIATGFEQKIDKDPVKINLSDSNNIEDYITKEKVAEDEDKKIEILQTKIFNFDNEVLVQEISTSDENNINNKSFVDENKIIFELDSEIKPDHISNAELIKEEVNIDNPAVIIDEIKNEDNLSDNNFEKNDITDSSKTEIDKNVSSISNKSLESREREERLREISKKLRTPSGLTYLEEQPAYKRNNVTLENVPKSDKEDTTNFTLEQNGEDITLKKNNSFLHDNVD